MKALADAREARPRNLSTLRSGILAVGMASAVPTAYWARRLLAPHGLRHHRGRRQRGHVRPRRHHEQACETSGRTCPGFELRVVDPETGHNRPVGVPGELWVRTRYMMQGYYGRPQETGARPRRRQVVSHRRHGALASRRLHRAAPSLVLRSPKAKNPPRLRRPHNLNADLTAKRGHIPGKCSHADILDLARLKLRNGRLCHAKAPGHRALRDAACLPQGDEILFNSHLADQRIDTGFHAGIPLIFFIEPLPEVVHPLLHGHPYSPFLASAASTAR